MAQSPLFLKIWFQGKLISHKQFLQDQVSIGSAEKGPVLVLLDPSVSYWHALIEKKGEEYYISDLGSSTGTFLNSQQILESRLNHGDKITIGDFILQFYVNTPFFDPNVDQSSPNKKGSEATRASQPPLLEEKNTAVSASTRASQPPLLEEKDTAVSASTRASQPPLLEEKDTAVSASTRASQPPLSEEKDTAVSASTRVPHPPLSEEQDTAVSASTRASQPPLSEEKDTAVSASTRVPHPPLSEEQDTLFQTGFPISEEKENTGAQILKETEWVPSPPKREEKTNRVSPPFPQDQIDNLEEVKKVFRHSNTAEQTRKNFNIKSFAKKATYAPGTQIPSLEKHLNFSSGPIIEVLVAWKDRVLSVNHFSNDSNKITLGSHPRCNICLPNLLGVNSYTLMNIKEKVNVHISNGVQMVLFDKKGEYSLSKLIELDLVTTQGLSQIFSLNQSQLLRLDFQSSIYVYIRYVNRVQKASLSPFFAFSFSELLGIMMSFFCMSVLVLYLAINSLNILGSTEKIPEPIVNKAVIQFEPKRKVVVLKEKKTSPSIAKKVKKKKVNKKRGLIKKKKKEGRIVEVAKNPKKVVIKSKKPRITTIRSGGGTNKKKSGSRPKSKRPDPTKIGLLSTLGSKGTQKVLDQAYSGLGDLAGVAEEATGYAGQKDSSNKKGIGTEFKDVGVGGKGNSLVGVSERIKTKGRGGGGKGYNLGGNIGQREELKLDLTYTDWEVGGGVDKEAVRRIIRRNKYKLEGCYNINLQKTPDSQGKVFVEWEILNERVRNVKVTGHFRGSASVGRCIKEQIKQFRFTAIGLKSGQIGVVKIPFALTTK